MTVQVQINMEECILCLECIDACPSHALTHTLCGGFYHQSELCSYCESCFDVCTEQAIEITEVK
jgi:formate hydrogenlyase subunit 6/NADH:ubiquinone oxidoreductase subunit I